MQLDIAMENVLHLNDLIPQETTYRHRMASTLSSWLDVVGQELKSIENGADPYVMMGPVPDSECEAAKAFVDLEVNRAKHYFAQYQAGKAFPLLPYSEGGSHDY